MHKSPNSSIFHKQNKTNTSYVNYEDMGYGGESFSKYGYQIIDLQKKMECFGGMDEVEEEVLGELNRASQRLDAITSKVRSFLKLQPTGKEKKPSFQASYSPSPIQSQLKQSTKHNGSQVQKSQPKAMRLKDRVEKVLQQQDNRNANLTRQPKYIK